MTISKFDKSLLIEQIRYIESASALSCDDEDEFSDLSSHYDFQQRLWLRAQCLVKQHDLSSALSYAAGISRNIKILTLLMALVFGALGTVYAITDSQSINIYGLLLVLLGFNFISMVLWLIGISVQLRGLSASVLARLSGWLPARFENKSGVAEQQAASQRSLAGRAWVNCCLTGAVGKWQLSKLTHQLWLLYLLAGVVSLLLLLMVRQYDFVWGTTLLSDGTFVSLTELLSRPLEWFGFSAPSADQVQQSRMGADVQLTAELRASWAQFILGSLLCFGLLPRLLLLLFSSLMSIQARNRFTLDLYQPYYINLRQRLMPLASQSEIVDADSRPQQASSVRAVDAGAHDLPEHTRWVAVELGSHFSWPIATIDASENLGQVLDRQSLASISQQIKQQSIKGVAVVVDASRLPDRGIQRTISTLLADTAERWLVLLQLSGQQQRLSRRLGDWYQLAQACDIPAEHVVKLSVDE